MIEYITNNLFDFSVNALNTSEKLKGLSRFYGPSDRGMADIRIFVAGLILAGVLLVILILCRKNRKWKEEEISRNIFERNVERLALDALERKLLLDIAKNSKLKKIDSIFTVSSAFDQGAAAAMKRSFMRGKTLVERKQMAALLVSHQPGDALIASERTAFIHEGRVIALQPTRQLLEKPDLVEVRSYLGSR